MVNRLGMAMVHFSPEVVIDPAIPVPEWPLSPVGVAHMRRAAEQDWAGATCSVFCSSERKAREAAELLAGKRNLTPCVIPALGENGRSSTGYLPKHEFELVADQFFAHPAASVRGWERALDAQHRIVAAVHEAIAAAPAGDVAIVSHGGVGALLLCHIKKVPISREADQPGAGGGNRFSFDRLTWQLGSGWQLIDE